MIPAPFNHYNDVIMTTIGSQITSLAVVYSTVYSDAYQRKHQSSASLAFVWGIHRDRWIPRTKGQLRGKCFYLMTSSWTIWDICVLHRVYYQRGVVDIYCHHPAVTKNCYTLICLTQHLIDSEFYLFLSKHYTLHHFIFLYSISSWQLTKDATSISYLIQIFTGW